MGDTQISMAVTEDFEYPLLGMQQYITGIRVPIPDYFDQQALVLSKLLLSLILLGVTDYSNKIYNYCMHYNDVDCAREPGNSKHCV